ADGGTARAYVTGVGADRLGARRARGMPHRPPGRRPGRGCPRRHGGQLAGVNLVNAELVGKTHGTTVVLHDVSLGIADGERIGVVGRNGSGKSTLLRALARLEDVDAGRVTHVGNLDVGLLGQRDDLIATSTVRHTVVGSAAEHEWAGDARVR